MPSGAAEGASEHSSSAKKLRHFYYHEMPALWQIYNQVQDYEKQLITKHNIFQVLIPQLNITRDI